METQQNHFMICEITIAIPEGVIASFTSYTMEEVDELEYCAFIQELIFDNIIKNEGIIILDKAGNIVESVYQSHQAFEYDVKVLPFDDDDEDAAKKDIMIPFNEYVFIDSSVFNI